MARNVSGLPPTMIALAEADAIRDDGLLYYKRLRDAGVKVRYKLYKGAIHGFFNHLIGGLIQPSLYKEAMNDVNTFITGLS